MAVFGHIEEFQPEKGSSWDQYCERLGFYFEANNIENSNTKRAVLFSVCGPATYAIIRSLVSPDSPTTVEYEAVLKKVKEHFNPKPSEIVQRFKFQKRDQRPDESISKYVAELRALAENCSYGDTLNSMLRDRLVCGIRDEAIQRKLLAEPDLTLEIALRIAIASEAAHLQTQELRAATGSHQDTEEQIHQVAGRKSFNKPAAKSNSDKDYCFRCGAEHNSSSCRFRFEKCRFCNKTGHIEKVCFARARTVKEEKKRGMNAHAHMLEDGDYAHAVNVGQHKLFELNQIETASKHLAMEPIYITVALNGRPHKMELDSGSSCSVISSTAFYKLWPKDPPRLLRQDNTLQTWTKQKLKILGFCWVNVRFRGYSSRLSLFVVEGNGQSLLGRPWWRALGLGVSGIYSCSMRPPDRSDRLDELLTKYGEVFGAELGGYRGPLVTIDVDPEVHPRFMKCRTVPFALRSKLDRALSSLIQQGIFTPVRNSRWATPIVTVLKKNGELRICGDYKSTVNLAAKKDTYPLPTVNEVLASLAGGVVFSKLDLAQAYQQLKVDDATADLLTLNTPQGLMKVNRLQFGVNAAAGIFQRFMESWLAGIEGVKPYLDDIFITGHTVEEHYQRLESVLRRLAEAGLRLRKEKCKFAVDNMEVLGYKIDKDTVRPTSEKVEAIYGAPVPTNKTELQAFLGLLNFYNCFLKDRATVLEPLHRLLDKGIKWTWRKNHDDAFRKAKNLLASSSVLVHYDPNKPLSVVCDASPYGLGAVLSQEMEDGHEAPVAFASRTLARAERNYAQIDKEALAVIFAIKKFHQYLAGRHFRVYTDHKPLLGLLRQSSPLPAIMSPRMLRWSLLLGAYDYEILYRPGKELGNADGLSRLPVLVPELEVYAPGNVLMLEALPNLPIGAKEVARDSKRDRIISRVLRWTLTRWPEGKLEAEMKPFFSRKLELSAHKDCLLWGNRVVIPELLRESVLTMLHEAHPGIVRMKALARSYVWWPGMDAAIERLVNNCNSCQSTRGAPAKAPEHVWERSKSAWSRIHIDFAGPFQGSTFLVVVDSYSKWVDVMKMSSMSSYAVIEHLAILFATHGIPDILVSDNGTAFTSEEFQKFMRANHILHRTVAPYHPSSNGQAERLVGVTKDALRKIVAGSWRLRLAKYLLNQHITPNCATGYSPAELLMSKRLKSNLDHLHPDNFDLQRNCQKEDAQLAEAAETTRKFEPAESVYARNYNTGAPKWVPASVDRVTGPVSYVVRTQDGLVWRRHVDQLRSRQSEELIEAEPREGECETENDTEIRSTPQPSGVSAEVAQSPVRPTTEQNAVQAAPETPGGRMQRVRKRPAYLDEYV